MPGLFALLVLGGIAALGVMALGLRTLGRARAAGERIEVLVLGPRGAGKTLLVARLVHCLLHRPVTAARAPRWAAHLPNDRDERRLRGHALDPTRPGLRSSKAMVDGELRAFAETGRNAPSEVPERVFLRLYLTADGADGVESLVCTLVDIPGAHLEASEHHEALHPVNL